MREIKFRAWHKNMKCMCQNVKIDLLDRDYLEFLQYTGLKDKKGKEIYEGDIVRDLIDYSIHKVIYLEKHWYGYVFENINTEECNNLFEFDEVEVIGNIYENPELLSSQK